MYSIIQIKAIKAEPKSSIISPRPGFEIGWFVIAAFGEVEAADGAVPVAVPVGVLVGVLVAVLGGADVEHAVSLKLPVSHWPRLQKMGNSLEF
jgi:hypothetical protein